MIKGTEFLGDYVLPVLIGCGVGLAVVVSLVKLAVLILLGAG